jgi:hypothetical protein
MMRKILLGFALVSVIGFGLYLKYRHANPVLETAYAGNHQVTLWSTTAQVREPVLAVNYGERLAVLQRFEEEVKVRTKTGVTGWVSQKELLSEDLWDKAKDLEKEAASMPVEARGHTRVLSNLHIEPGRDMARLQQLAKQVPIALLERRVADVPLGKGSAAANSGEDDASTAPATTKKEDWWLVLARVPDEPPVAGWLLGQFVELDVPQPLPDYASSADMRVVAWFELNRVEDSSGNERPQYLVVGTRGPEGQPCDFTMMRVYTWGNQRQRYETAFVDSKACGSLPIQITPEPGKTGELTFTFNDIGSGTPIPRTYRMHQTMVRLVKAPGEALSKKTR